MQQRCFAAALAALVLSSLSALPARADAKPRLDGLWQGEIVYRPASIELDLMVEIAAGADGRLVGTFDFPAERMKYHPLQNVRLDGSAVAFEFDRMPGKDAPDNHFRFDGKLSPDGRRIEGQFSGRANGEEMRLPFSLNRTGEAGSERPREVNPPLTLLAENGDELRQAFNRDRGKVRLVLLLSPTCATCRASAWVTQKYVLDAIHDASLKVYVVWGPMLGDEKEADAREATSRLPDPRATHFWTSSSKVAQAFAKALKLPAGTPAWDTFQLYPPGPTWDAVVPAPAHFMHLNQPLPEELTFDAKKLAEQARGALPSAAGR